MCVESLTVGITPTCDATKKPAGVAPDFYVAAIADVDTITFDPTDNFITGFTMKATKVFVKIQAKQRKHSYTEPIQDQGEGNVDLYQQTFAAKVFYSTQAQINAIQDIVSIDRALVVYLGRDGKFKVVGVTQDQTKFPFSDWGVQVTSGDDPSGINLNDESAQALSFVGDMPNKAMYFGEGDDVATNLALLDGYLTNP